MEKFYSLPFTLLECPHLKLKKPSWIKQPSAMTVFAFVLLSYFLVTGGNILFPFSVFAVTPVTCVWKYVFSNCFDATLITKYHTHELLWQSSGKVPEAMGNLRISPR